MVLIQNTTCFGKSLDDPQSCSGNGFCESTDQCLCNYQYTGKDCAETSCFGVSSLNGNACNGVGNCSSYDTCTCKVGYGGKQCEENYIQNDFTTVYSMGYNAVNNFI